MAETVAAGRRRIPISHPEREVFSAAGLTKLDLARHYATVGEAMVPHVRDRPLALHTFPSGVDGKGFFLKNTPRHFPDWIPMVRVSKRDGGTLRQALGNSPDALVYLAGQNMVTPHIWTSRADRLERPDRIVFDLDPDDQDFAEIRAAARALGALLRDLGLTPFAMTTGSRGLHVVVALRRTAGFEAVHGFARAVADALVDEHPDALTTEFMKAKRGGRLYVDVNSNGYGQHAVAPYAVRALANAPVATPLAWDELDDAGLDPQGWTIPTIGQRLADGGDRWRDLGRAARAVGPAARALERRR